MLIQRFEETQLIHTEIQIFISFELAKTTQLIFFICKHKKKKNSPFFKLSSASSWLSLDFDLNLDFAPKHTISDSEFAFPPWPQLLTTLNCNLLHWTRFMYKLGFLLALVLALVDKNSAVERQSAFKQHGLDADFRHKFKLDVYLILSKLLLLCS